MYKYVWDNSIFLINLKSNYFRRKIIRHKNPLTILCRIFIIS